MGGIPQPPALCCNVPLFYDTTNFENRNSLRLSCLISATVKVIMEEVYITKKRVIWCETERNFEKKCFILII